MKKKISTIIMLIILLLSSIMIVGSIYYSREYAEQEFDQILYYILHGIEGTSSSVITEVINHNIGLVIVVFLIMIIFVIKNINKTIYIKIKYKEKEKKIQVYPIKITANHRIIYTTIIFIFALITTVNGFKIDTYVKYNLQTTDIYEQYYVDGSTKDIKFPEQKRNLIIISIERMEN